MEPVRIGVLGAARIVKSALAIPARELEGVAVRAVAARDQERARKFAQRLRIPLVHRSYEALLTDPDIDAVYIGLPAALHGEWTAAAIAAGKHVLCEKPFTANGDEADRIAGLAASSSAVVMEAYHTAHHPFIAQLRAFIDSGVVGSIRTARARFCVPIPPGKDIRWNHDLAGGGLLDIGYYPVRLLRDLLGEPQVTSAIAKQRDGIDRHLAAQLSFPDGISGSVVSAMWAAVPPAIDLHLVGTSGRVAVQMPYHPHHARMKAVTTAGTTRERPERRTTYSFQLEAFRDAIREGGPNRTDPVLAAAHLRTLDAIYAAAGMAPRRGRL